MRIPPLLRLWTSFGKDRISAGNTVIIATCVVVVFVMFGTSFTEVAIFPYGNKFQYLKLGVYVFMTILLSVVNVLFLNRLQKIRKKSGKKMLKSFHLDVLYKTLKFTQYGLIGILTLIFVEIISANSYSNYLSIVAVSMTHIMSIVLLMDLNVHFLKWFMYKKNIAVFSLIMAVTMILLNIGSMFVYYLIQTKDNPQYISSFRGQVTSFYTSSDLGTMYFITYILSFLLIWVATVVLLYNYSTMVGRIKFWFIMSIPLIYFVIQFQPQILNLIIPVQFSNPVFFGIVYTLLFSGAKPIGGILAGIAFWSIAMKVNQKEVKDFLMLSACGIILLFASNQANRLLTPAFPPIELSVVSYMALGSYLLVVGIYFSAISVAQDTRLRKYILQSTKSIKSQLGFLGNIGSSEMQEEIRRKVEVIAEKFADKMEEESGIPTSSEQGEIRDYIRKVINEKINVMKQ